MDNAGVLKSVIKSSSTGGTGLASKIRNIEGNIRLPIRNVTFMKPLNDKVDAGNEASMGDKQQYVEENTRTREGGEDPGVKATKSRDANAQATSFASILTAGNKIPKINFRTLFNEERVDDVDCVLPIEDVEIAHSRFANSLVGFFVGKRVAFPLVQNYVINTWTKFGFQKVIKDDDDVYYFKFTSITGLEQVLEKGPWMIRNQPLILTKWAPNLDLAKDVVTKVPVWVKIHKVPVVAYSDDGLSLIASQIGTPVMLDAFTTAMCTEPWGRIGYARALIEVSADKDLKKEVIMAVPIVKGEGHIIERMAVDYEWTPPRCMDCKVFGHLTQECPKRIVENVNMSVNESNEQPDFTIVRNKKSKGKKVAIDSDDGFTTVINRKHKGQGAVTMQKDLAGGFKVNNPKKFMYQPVIPKSNNSKPSSSGAIHIAKERNKEGETNGIKLKNLFEKLNDITYIADPSSENDPLSEKEGVGMTSNSEVPCTLHTDDSDSEVEEVFVEENPNNANVKGASTPSTDGGNV
ncbi:hypothetical protein Tco_1200771 [Tanacetum coccineum]